jgi:hypothetical protein
MHYIPFRIGNAYIQFDISRVRRSNFLPMVTFVDLSQGLRANVFGQAGDASPQSGIAVTLSSRDDVPSFLRCTTRYGNDLGRGVR